LGAVDRRVVVALLNNFIAGLEGPERFFWALSFDLPR
jgi:hypothetical protein